MAAPLQGCWPHTTKLPGLMMALAPIGKPMTLAVSHAVSRALPAISGSSWSTLAIGLDEAMPGGMGLLAWLLSFAWTTLKRDERQRSRSGMARRQACHWPSEPAPATQPGVTLMGAQSSIGSV